MHTSLRPTEQLTAETGSYPGVALTNGLTWGLQAVDALSAEAVTSLTMIMQLIPQRAPQHLLRIHSAASGPSFTLLSGGPDDSLLECLLGPAESDLWAVQLSWLALVLALHVEDQGGILLHGALAEREGRGVILAAPGGTGKTTASSRLPTPWRSLSDDATLVVLDTRGVYWAHPWPTWSRFMFGGPGGSWSVSTAVPLAGVFFLEQAAEDQVQPLGVGESACRLSGSAEQIGRIQCEGVSTEESRRLRLRRFDNSCALARALPAFRLGLMRDGAFWQVMEQALGPSAGLAAGALPDRAT